LIRTELSLRLPNNAGAVAGVYRLLSDAHVSVLAMSVGAGGELRLVVDNHVHGAGLLRERRHTVDERDVLVVEGSAGPAALRLIADAGINLNYTYGGPAALVLGVDDVMRASAASGL